jgi:predicted hotdog family 3-hydroxylacyl-ACP dehydratase
MPAYVDNPFAVFAIALAAQAIAAYVGDFLRKRTQSLSKANGTISTPYRPPP